MFDTRGLAKKAVRYINGPPKKTSDKIPPPEFLHVPHNYVLKNSRDVKRASKKFPPEINSTVEFYVIGCGGTGESPQKQVAELMHKIASGEIKKPKFIIILGDNFYKEGVVDENDAQFQTKFQNVYQDPELTGICGIPCFLIPGNHDHNVQMEGTDAHEIDFNRILGQINYSRLDKGKKSIKRERMFKSPQLDLTQLGAFNMPSRYYSLLIKGEEKSEYKAEEKDRDESDLLMCFADTTTLVKDYLNYKNLLAERKEDLNNQVSWLKSLAAKNPKAIKLLFSHHSRIAADKRAFHSDAGDYLSAEDIENLAKPPINITGSYNEMLNSIFNELRLDFKLDFDANFSAHTHSLFYYNNGCDLFLMAPSEKEAYEISSKNKVYLYRDENDGFFYHYQLNNRAYRFELPHVSSLTALLANNEFDQTPGKPQVCQNRAFTQAVLNLTSERNHTPMFEAGRNLCQVGAGGGGGKLEYRYRFDFNARDMTYLKNHGFVKVSVDLSKGQEPDCLMFDYYTTQGSDFQLLPSNPTNDKIIKHDLYLYQENNRIWYATKTSQGVIRAEVTKIECPEHFDYLLAILKQPFPENEKATYHTKAALLDIASKKGHIPQSLHLKFKNNSTTPIRDSASETPQVVLLRDTVLKACRQYLFNAGVAAGGLFNKPSHHGLFGMNRAQNMINFFNRYEPINFSEAMSYIANLMGVSRATWTDDNSLEPILKKALREGCGWNYDALIEKYGKHLDSTFEPAEPGVVSSVASSVASNIGSLATHVGNALINANYFRPA